MMEINCLVCGKAIEIPQFIDTDNYDGQINCPGCKSLLQVRLFGAKLRKYEVVEKGGGGATESRPAPMVEVEGMDVESVARYNPLRDYLASYRATQLNLTFGYIESIIKFELETAAYTFKSWWANNRKNPQAMAWLEAGWEVEDVDLQREGVVFKRVKAR
jgi:DNA-directed RNA polymerase subunit RPC12/RpoP